MTTAELRAQIEACLEECGHAPSSEAEFMMMLTKTIMLLCDTIADAADVIDTAIRETAPPGIP